MSYLKCSVLFFNKFKNNLYPKFTSERSFIKSLNMFFIKKRKAIASHLKLIDFKSAVGIFPVIYLTTICQS